VSLAELCLSSDHSAVLSDTQLKVNTDGLMGWADGLMEPHVVHDADPMMQNKFINRGRTRTDLMQKTWKTSRGNTCNSQNDLCVSCSSILSESGITYAIPA